MGYRMVGGLVIHCFGDCNVPKGLMDCLTKPSINFSPGELNSIRDGYCLENCGSKVASDSEVVYDYLEILRIHRHWIEPSFITRVGSIKTLEDLFVKEKNSGFISLTEDERKLYREATIQLRKAVREAGENLH